MISLVTLLCMLLGASCVVIEGATTPGSGSSCVNFNPCNNEGSCIEGGDCTCQTGWTGPTCKTKTGEAESVHYTDSGTFYTLIPSKMTFGDATGECRQRFGRIVSNVADTNVLRALRNILEKATDTVGAAMEFWVIAEKYPGNLPHLTEERCSASNASGIILTHPCENTLLPVICAKPTSGDCYSEIWKGRCHPPKDMCRYNETSLNCVCREGYQEDTTKTKCEDIDECLRVPCVTPSTVCQNTPGSYRCGCRDKIQGNGADTCGYVLTMAHINVNWTEIPDVGINLGAFTTQPSLPIKPTTPIGPRPSFLQLPTMPMDHVEKAKEHLQDKLNSIFRVVTKSIQKVVVKSISPLSNSSTTTVVYDLYTTHSEITPTSVIEFYNEVERQGKVHWLKGSRPTIAPVVCTPSALGLGSKLYNFSSSIRGSKAFSEQQCPDGRNIATVECKTKENEDGSETAFYDYKSVVAIPCYISMDTVNDLVSNINSTQTAETAMRDLDSLTSDITKVNTRIFEQAADSITKVANYVWDTKVDINVATMTSMINVANSINKAQKYDRGMKRESQLNVTQRRDIVMSLERCSTHVQTGRLETITIESESVTMQVTNGLPHKDSGISYNEISKNRPTTNTLHLSGNSCPPKGSPGVRSFIHPEVVKEAKKIKTESTSSINTLPVSFVHFADSEFFTPDTDKYEIEQVLSVRISNLELKNLENPVWFQIPPVTSKRNKKSKRYYKCAFLNDTTGEWRSDGCTTIPGSNPPNCTCDHMTNFAILVQTHEQLQEYSLEIVGKVCCVISIVGLLLMLLIHLYFPSLRKSQVVKIHSHLGFCLLVSYIILLSSTERPKPYGVCIASASILQFFLLSSWGWMVVECITMYRKLVAVFSKSISHYVTKAAGTVYLISFGIVLITILISVTWYDSTNFNGWITLDSDFFPSSYVSDRLCWLHSYSLIFGFLMPVGLAFVVSFFGAIVILWSITYGREEISSRSTKKNEVRDYVFRAVTVSVLLGMSWIFAIPLTLSDDPIVNSLFGWLFSITNALQGFFMFLLFCVRRKDVRKLWINELKNFFNDEDNNSITDSRDVLPGATTTAASQDITATTEPTNVIESSNNYMMDTVEQEITRENNEYPTNNKSRRIGKISTFHPTTANKSQ